MHCKLSIEYMNIMYANSVFPYAFFSSSSDHFVLSKSVFKFDECRTYVTASPIRAVKWKKVQGVKQWKKSSSIENQSHGCIIII